MKDEDYFDLRGDSISDQERAFLRALRAQIDGRVYPVAGHVEGAPEGGLLVMLHVDAPGTALLTVGVYFMGDRIMGDRIDHQVYDLPERPTDMAIDVSGPVDELALRTAEWFEAILLRPIVRHEWLHQGAVYAFRYLLADTGEGFVQMYNRELAPKGQAEQLTAGGHVFGQGWVQTTGLGAPDRVIAIRPQ